MDRDGKIIGGGGGVRVMLSDEPESDNGEVMIECVCKSDLRSLHYHETGCVDRGELMQIVPSKIAPRLLQIP